MQDNAEHAVTPSAGLGTPCARLLQASRGCRLLDEGSVICLQVAQPLGRVEEVFGPVDEPLYSTRYACGGPMPESLSVGCKVMSVERLSTYLTPETVQACPLVLAGNIF